MKRYHVAGYAALIIAVLFGVGLYVHGLASDVTDAKASAHDAQASAIANSAAVDVLVKQLRDEGIPPAIDPNLLPNPVSGPEGPQGVQGIQGLPGPQGEPGPAGPAGPRGPRGAQGVTGVSGSDGTSGATGATGPTGPAGPEGPAGPQGDKGERGEPGPAGYPVSWTWIYDPSPAPDDEITYLCTDTDGDHQYTCEPQGATP